MMKRSRLYIIMCVFSLLAFVGCREDDTVQPEGKTRTVIVNLGIAVSRATGEDEGVVRDLVDKMQVWVFDDNGNPIEGGYVEIDNPRFSIKDLENKLVESVSMKFNITEEIKKLQFRVVLNADNVGIKLGKESKMSDIDEATFTLPEKAITGDNQVPMYGKPEEAFDEKRNYDIDIEMTRAVSKLEVYFTKKNPESTLMIQKMTLSNIPDKGFLAEGEQTWDKVTYNKTTMDEFSGNKEVEQSLPDDNALGSFSEHPDDFTLIPLLQPYLLENPNNERWDENTPDDVYPSTSDGADAYILTVQYQLNGRNYSQEIVLPEVRRNIWNKIFARVTDKGEVDVVRQILVNAWENKGEMDVIFGGKDK